MAPAEDQADRLEPGPITTHMILCKSQNLSCWSGKQACGLQELYPRVVNTEG